MSRLSALIFAICAAFVTAQESPQGSVLGDMTHINLEASPMDAAGVPLITLHGIGDACANPGMAQITKQLASAAGVYGTCVEYGGGISSWFTTLEAQTEKACNIIKADSNLANGFNIVGLSQGNLVARGIIQKCGVKVYNYASLGGPHDGTSIFPQCTSGPICKILNGVINLGVYNSIIQGFIAPANYFKDVAKYDTYLKASGFLADINNERATKNPDYVESMASLCNLALVMFDADTVLAPKQTEWFGFYPANDQDPKASDVVLLRNSPMYSQDWLGLKRLDKAGRLSFVTQPGQHLNIDQALIDNTVMPLLKGTKACSVAPKLNENDRVEMVLINDFSMN